MVLLQRPQSNPVLEHARASAKTAKQAAFADLPLAGKLIK